MRKTIAFTAVLLILLTASCSMYSVLPDNTSTIQSPGDLIRWIHERVEYEMDYLNYFKSPREILESGKGDCEDFCTLFASMAHDLWGWKPEMQLVYLEGYWFHYFLVWDGVIYDPTNRGHSPVGGYPIPYTVYDKIKYDVYIWYATAGYQKNLHYNN